MHPMRHLITLTTISEAAKRINIGGWAVTVLTNPSVLQVGNALNKYKELRWVVDDAEDTFVWNAGMAVHDDVSEALGLFILARGTASTFGAHARDAVAGHGDWDYEWTLAD